MRLETAREEAVLSVAQRMREWDKREIYGALWDETPDALAQMVMVSARAGPCMQVALIGADPVCVFGAGWMSPAAVQVFAFGTDRFNEIALPLTRYLKRRLFPAMAEAGVTRAECRTLEGHTEAYRWLTLLGAKEECRCPKLGKNGETYIQMAWSDDDVLGKTQGS